MSHKNRLLLGFAALLPLAACEQPAAQNAAAPAETASAETGATTDATAGVVREPVLAEPVPAPPPAQPVLQTQPGPKGAQVALNKVAVTGDVLTVQLIYSGATGYDYVPLGEVSVIDDATAQRIGVLKDNAGKWLAAPVQSDGKELRIPLEGPSVVWAKFPAPPPTSATVSINIPNVAPFDGVPVTR